MTKRERLYHPKKRLERLVKRLDVRWGTPINQQVVYFKDINGIINSVTSPND